MERNINFKSRQFARVGKTRPKVLTLVKPNLILGDASANGANVLNKPL